MFKDWWQATQSMLLRLRLQEPKLVFFPRFRLTSLGLWAFAIAGLLYGHVFEVAESSRPLSLLFSGIAGFGSLFLILLRDPWDHFRRFLTQLWSLIWIIGFVFLGLLSLLVWGSATSDLLVKLTWTAATLLIGGVGIKLAQTAFLGEVDPETAYYPGMRSASVLVGLFILNYVIWVSQSLMQLVR